MHCTATVSAVISVAESVIFTQIDEAGSTLGNVARFASAPPSLLTWKSPAAIVGLLLNELGSVVLRRAM